MENATHEQLRTVGESPELFREGMSRYGTAVHVVTTDGRAGKTGMTATAVCSVTDNPPTLLVCLNRKSESTRLVVANGVFCVNTLGYDDQTLSDVFAGRTEARLSKRFDEDQWGLLKTGAPVLASAIVACDCRISEVKTVGTHEVIFGIVQSVALKTEQPALVYHGRIYKPL